MFSVYSGRDCIVGRYYITCLNLSRLLDMRTDAQTVPPAKDVGHLGNVPDQRRSVQVAPRTCEY